MNSCIEMPEVKKCEVSECVYNRENACHARGITVGGLTDHLCDTMIAVGGHIHRKGTSGIGACKAINCLHNDEFDCQADGICVGMADGKAQCLTFAGG